MNETSTNIPSGDPRRPTKRLNPQWVLARVIAFVLPAVADIGLGILGWRAAYVPTTTHLNYGYVTEYPDPLGWRFWCISNALVAVIALGVLAVWWWEEPRFKP